MNSLRYVFGPVPSRRLGRSLGVDVIPRKTCTLDCVYCELGPTDKRALRRKEYVPTDEVIDEIQTALSRGERIDTITFSGSGEPTLHSSLGTMIRAARRMTGIPVAVLTNGTLLHLRQVRRDLAEADIVLPSLDAASTEVFNRVNRPHPQLRLESMIEGLKLFRKEFSGQIWLEVMVVRGFNDGVDEIRTLKEITDQINPDRIQVNTVVRPPAVPQARPAPISTLEAMRDRFGARCEVIAPVRESPDSEDSRPDADRIVAALRRRPMTTTEIASSFNAPLEMIRRILQELETKECIREYDFEGKQFFEVQSEPAENAPHPLQEEHR